MVAHAILTTKFSHVIAFYIESCKFPTFHLYLNPAILHAVKPSQKKLLARLGDIAAFGMLSTDTTFFWRTAEFCRVFCQSQI